MLSIVASRRFLKDVKLAERRGQQMAKLEEVIRMLTAGEELPARLRDHALSGDLSTYRDCHIQPDWLLIYRVDESALYLARTGSHSDLFSR